MGAWVYGVTMTGSQSVGLICGQPIGSTAVGMLATWHTFSKVVRVIKLAGDAWKIDGALAVIVQNKVISNTNMFCPTPVGRIRDHRLGAFVIGWDLNRWVMPLP